MLSEIIVYELIIKKSIPFLFFFKKTEKIIYRLTYRIDEDRLWYYKLDKKEKVIEDHLMKQDLSSSLFTMENIKERYQSFNGIFLEGNTNISEYSIKNKENQKLVFDLISNYSSSKKEYYDKRKSTSNASGYHGMFLSSDENELLKR